ncbi:hypothetical protein, partial [Streptacidiphilus neutrinimicus]|uniref:hypothetical protein n=1 Tax=Streptacidiphilus neutrinimicus TaxID=105420 RepID=UPI001F457E0A
IASHHGDSTTPSVVESERHDTRRREFAEIPAFQSPIPARLVGPTRATFEMCPGKPGGGEKQKTPRIPQENSDRGEVRPKTGPRERKPE